MPVRYEILAVGKLRRGFYRTACDHYLARLRNHGSVDVTEVREGRGDAVAVRTTEGDALLQRATGWLVALDERGERVTSRRLAEQIELLAVRGESRLAFAIGGAEGLSDAVRSRADAVWRLSDLTLPHELARLLLLEQLYRAETIRAGHPYHRG